MKKTIAFLYFTVLAIDCYLIGAELEKHRYFSKSLLMPLLMVYLVVQVGTQSRTFSRNLVLGALLLSFAGDVLLLKGDDPRFFIAGLICFFIVQVLYIFFFRRVMRNRGITVNSLVTPALFMLLYGAIFNYLLWEPAKELRVPVVMYTLVLSVMIVTAFLTLGRSSLKKITTQFFVPGAVFFVLSDSMLAIDKFLLKESFIQVLVMITYGVAQFLLTAGAVKYINRRSRA